jgi:hypothetical protein
MMRLTCARSPVPAATHRAEAGSLKCILAFTAESSETIIDCLQLMAICSGVCKGGSAQISSSCATDAWSVGSYGENALVRMVSLSPGDIDNEPRWTGEFEARARPS